MKTIKEQAVYAVLLVERGDYKAGVAYCAALSVLGVYKTCWPKSLASEAQAWLTAHGGQDIQSATEWPPDKPVADDPAALRPTA